MTKWILAAGAAALAISTPALADRGGHGGGQAAHANQGGGGKAHGAKADRGGHGSQGFAAHGGGKGQGHAARLVGFDDHGKGHGNIKVRGNDRVVVKSRGFDDSRVRVVSNDGNRFAANGLGIGGCPPGLANKGCMPPGQAKKLVGTRWASPLQSAFLPAAYRNWYPDNNDYLYRERDGYVYRIDRNRGLIDGLFPMFSNDGNYFAVGQRYPLDYDFYNVPTQYQSYYPDSSDYLYRYGDGGIYQVNRSNGMVEGIAALLAGDLGVGQRLPMGYGAYNVPLGYRDQYYDTADTMYRYNDGYIYRVDPKTQLIQAVISALI